jgi:hypothetical protein
MTRILNVKVNHEGIIMDYFINYDNYNPSDDETITQMGYRFWDDDPKEFVRWLKNHLVDNAHKYERVDISVEGVEL